MRRVIYISMMLLLAGCGGKAKPTAAQFNRPQAEVEEELKNLYNFEEVTIQWTQNRIDEGRTSNRDVEENIKWTANQIEDGVGRNLKVYLTNGNIDPDTNEEKDRIGREAMQIVLSAIDNQKDYEDFTVVFVHESTYDGMEMRSENPFRYELKEFQVGEGR